MSRTIDADSLLDDLQELLNQEVLGNTVSDVGIGIEIAMQRVMVAKDTTLNDMRDAIYEDAVAHGLWESADYNVLCGIEVWKRVGDLFDPDEAMRGQAMQIIRSEVDELDAASDDGEKYAEELADVIISSLSVAGKLGIDIDAAVRRKMEINKGRPWKHRKYEQGNV